MSVIARIMGWMSNGQHEADLRRAEKELEETRRKVEPIYDREPRVNRIASWLIADRAENHYGERIKKALEGK